ncbi:MAG TPA: methylmalonyl Co-A mutase-associated GTPase MeaB [Herpetosiphonaceae bacterium]|nr:methylmalonyl Co-A mutase-associated GTPase MeaB [Herpetosiphonaceae bacterium]
MELVEKALAGNRRALSRLITLVEAGDAQSRQALAAIYPHTGRAHIVGVTGAPGTGKSTLVNQLALHWRAAGRRVAVLAVDPTSPFSGGAILGDRIRMQALGGDPGCYIRSMASRGSLGGLSRATGDAVKVLDAAGFEIIIVETVGAGQAEVEITREAHTVVVVEIPGMGDDIQAIKAGILEIADVFVVNKSDREGAERTLRQLQMMLHLASGEPRDGWDPPIVQTVASAGKNIADAAAAVERHLEHLKANQLLRRRDRERLGREWNTILREALLQELFARVPAAERENLLNQMLERQIDPYAAAYRLVQRGFGPS